MHCTALANTPLALLPFTTGAAFAQPAPSPVELPQVDVNATRVPATPADAGAYASKPQFQTNTVTLGPLGTRSLLDTPASVTTIPEDAIVNQQVRTVNDTLRYLPSVEIRDQQGLEVSRPQSRGFQGSIVQNTRLDGLNIIGTTAIPAENLAGIQVLNGVAGSLFGPETPAGVFNYLLKRPTDAPLYRFIQGYDSPGIFTEQADIGGRTGPNGVLGYRINLVHGAGDDYVAKSGVNRTLLSTAFDIHIDDRTVVELNYSHYSTNVTGLPGSIVYDSGKSTILPKAPDPTRPGLGQPGAGTDLVTDTGLLKVKHQFNDTWDLEVGGLYQNADRQLYGITDTQTNDLGNFTVTKNFNAVPHFTIGSNLAYLNGHFDVFGLRNDLTLGTNGFINSQYSYKNSIAVNLGVGTLANPVVLPMKPTPDNGGQYRSAILSNQSLILGDTLHLGDKVALQGVLSASFIAARSYSIAGAVTSTDTRNGVLSPTVNLTYKPVPRLTTYASFSTSVEQGEQAPAGTANVNQVLSPYQDRQYEIGAKYAVTDRLILTLDGFRMTRPLATTVAAGNLFEVIGTQQNYGVEFFAQGELLPGLSALGGVTYIDARLFGTKNATTDGRLVVGVPQVKSDVLLDYHPEVFRGGALTAAGHFESQRAATNTNNSFAPDYSTLDLGARYSASYLHHYATARFQVINVTNTHYYSSIADGNIVGSPGANTAYLGAPRTFLASLELDF